MTNPTPIRNEYGTPRYAVTDRVETSDRDMLDRWLNLDLPPIPLYSGYYVLMDGGMTGRRWQHTDGLTYRVARNCIRVLP
jgi:hypothetical protein